jgi:putative ABC transport system permease protein
MMPFSTAERRAFGTQILGTVDMIYASTNGTSDLEPATQQIRDLLRERHHIQPKQDEDFTVRNLNEIAEASRMASQVMSNLLLSVASISLLVGGIGIMNIMLVSVTERTREIGVRMAVGARTGHILVQFLVEAVVVSAFGGLIGVGVGLLGTSLISRLAQWPTLVSGSAIALAFSFSALVGIVFGFYPAKRASALDPIAALRSE